MSRTVEIDGRRIELDNLDKLFFADAEITKGDVIGYYRDIAALMLPHLANRALTVQRYPDGIDAHGFYQKHAPDYAPEWIDTAEVSRREGGAMRQIVCDSEATLVWLADQGALVMHAPLARLDRPERPDRMVFDLDPPDDYDDRVRRAALALRDMLDDRGLRSFVKTTGSRGFHVVVPLRRDHEFDAVRGEARRIADSLVERMPKETTTAQRKDKRGGKIFIDTLRNAYGQTRVAPYSLRAKPGAPIACPLDWDELGRRDVDPRKFTLSNIRRRLAQKDDPWIRLDETRNRLSLTA